MRRWALKRAFHPVVRPWDDGTVVYNRLTGQTHVIDGLATAILAELSDHPIPDDELIARLAAREPGEPLLPEERSAVLSALEAMDRLGLVDRIDQP